MKCKCTNVIPEGRLALGYRTCINVALLSFIVIYQLSVTNKCSSYKLYHKNYLQLYINHGVENKGREMVSDNRGESKGVNAGSNPATSTKQ